MPEKLIELRDIRKSYGNVFALGGVSLSVNESEVVGLIGDNGAGKSTLIKILSGVVKPTSGEILVRGKPVTGWNAARSREAGIETVFQDRALAVQQSIVRNIFMGRELAGPLGLSRHRPRGEGGRTTDARDRLHLQGLHPALDRRPALRRRAPGRGDRPRDLQEGRPHRPRRADHRALPDRDRQGLPLRTAGAGERPLDPIHRPQHPPCLRHRRPLRRARPRDGRARGAARQVRLGRGPHRVHGAAGASRAGCPA